MSDTSSNQSVTITISPMTAFVLERTMVKLSHLERRPIPKNEVLEQALERFLSSLEGRPRKVEVW